MSFKSLDIIKTVAYSSVLAFSFAGAASAQVYNANEPEEQRTVVIETEREPLEQTETEANLEVTEEPEIGALAYENADELEDREVFYNGEEIGEVDEVLSGAGNKTYLVVEHGGFLDIGDEEFVVDLDEAEVTADRITISQVPQEVEADTMDTAALEEDAQLVEEPVGEARDAESDGVTTVR